MSVYETNKAVAALVDLIDSSVDLSAEGLEFKRQVSNRAVLSCFNLLIKKKVAIIIGRAAREITCLKDCGPLDGARMNAGVQQLLLAQAVFDQAVALPADSSKKRRIQ